MVTAPQEFLHIPKTRLDFVGLEFEGHGSLIPHLSQIFKYRVKINDALRDAGLDNHESITVRRVSEFYPYLTQIRTKVERVEDDSPVSSEQ